MKKVKKLLFSTIITLALAIVCFNFFPESAISAQAAKARINKRSVVLLKGQKEKLKIKGTKEEVKWKSRNKSVAKVSKKGVVTARKKGKTTIIARAGKKTYKCKVTVEQPYISGCGSKVGLGEKRQLFICGTSCKDVTWKSEFPNIVAVDENGVVTCKRISIISVTIYAYIRGREIEKTLEVISPYISSSDSASDSDIEILVGESMQFFMCGTSYKEFTWKSLYEEIATVDQNGVVTGKKEGTARIYADIMGYTISKNIRVYLSVEKEVTISTIFAGANSEIKVTNNGTEALKFECSGYMFDGYRSGSTHYLGSGKTDEGYVIVNPGETKTLSYYGRGSSSSLGYYFDASSSFYFWYKNERYCYYTTGRKYSSISQAGK